MEPCVRARTVSERDTGTVSVGYVGVLRRGDVAGRVRRVDAPVCLAGRGGGRGGGGRERRREAVAASIIRVCVVTGLGRGFGSGWAAGYAAARGGAADGPVHAVGRVDIPARHTHCVPSHAWGEP